VLSFVSLILGIALRIVFSTLVQVLAEATLKDSADSTVAKIVTLCSLATYFLWIGDVASIKAV